MVRTGFFIIGIVATLSVLIGIGLYSFIRKAIQKKNTSWLGVFFSGLSSLILSVIILYAATKFYINNPNLVSRIGCFYKVTDQKDNKKIASLLVSKANSLSQDLCFQEEGLGKDEFKCRKSQKTLIVNQRGAIYNGNICKHISEFPSE